MMKRLITVLVLVFLTFPLSSQDLISSLKEKMGDKEIISSTQINISGKMLSMAAKSDEGIDEETRKLFQNIKKINALIGVQIDDDLKKQLKKQLASYEELMSVVEDEQKIKMYTKETKGQIEEFVLCIIASNQMILMSIVGKIDLEQLAKLSYKMNIGGMEQLDKVKGLIGVLNNSQS